MPHSDDRAGGKTLRRRAAEDRPFRQRFAAALDLARTEGHEDALKLIRQEVLDGRLTKADARDLRLQFYKAIASWIDGDQPGLGRRGVVASDTPRQARSRPKEDNRGRAFRSGRRQAIHEAAARAENALVSQLAATLDHLDVLQARHETETAVAALRDHFTSGATWDVVPAIVAQRLLARAERLLMADAAPAALWSCLAPLDGDPLRTRGLQERKAFRTQLHASVKALPRFLSLGFNCMPWTVPNRWGLRTHADLFDLDTPFNLAIHRIESVLALIETDFEGYSDPAEMRAVQTPRGHMIAHNHRYRAVWNHEKNAYWLDDEFAMLRHHLDLRIDKFRRALASPQPTAFLLCLNELATRPDALEKTQRLLELLRTRSESDAVILICHSCRQDAAWSVTEPEPGLFHLATPYPSDSYDWHLEADYGSAEGIAFEQRYVEALLDAVRHAGLTAAAPPGMHRQQP